MIQNNLNAPEPFASMIDPKGSVAASPLAWSGSGATDGGVESVQVDRFGQMDEETGIAAEPQVLVGPKAAHGNARHRPIGM